MIEEEGGVEGEERNRRDKIEDEGGIKLRRG